MQKLAAVDREKPVPLTTQVVGAVLSAVLPGASEVLPSRRDMAEQLGVGLTTAANEVGGRDALRLAYWFSHYELGFSYQTIGAVLGRDQTTIWELAHACAAAMAKGPALAKKARKIARSLSPEVQRRGARAGWRAKAGLGAALSSPGRRRLVTRPLWGGRGWQSA